APSTRHRWAARSTAVGSVYKEVTSCPTCAQAGDPPFYRDPGTAFRRYITMVIVSYLLLRGTCDDGRSDEPGCAPSLCRGGLVPGEILLAGLDLFGFIGTLRFIRSPASGRSRTPRSPTCSETAAATGTASSSWRGYRPC